MPFDGTIVDLSCNMHHKWCRMICASFCNWSLYFHWQLLYMQKCELCAKSVKNVFVHLFSHSGECAKCVKNLIVHLFSLVTFTDGCWRAPNSCCFIGNSPGVHITIFLAKFLFAASLAVHNRTRVHKPTILMTNLFTCTTKPNCTSKTIPLDNVLRSRPNKALEWAPEAKYFCWPTILFTAPMQSGKCMKKDFFPLQTFCHHCLCFGLNKNDTLGVSSF